MRILFIGIGSIGKRHLMNLRELLTLKNIEFSIDALRTVAAPLDDELASALSHVFYDMAEIEGEYDAVFITNPSSLHYRTLKSIIPFAKAVFIEKPVFINPDEDIDSLGLRENAIYYVACPLRFSPVVQKMKRIAQGSRVISARAICSSYLPEWRRMDYRLSYSARRDMGGGVRLDLIHEMDYLLDIFGSPDRLVGVSSKYSDLEISCEDLACYILSYGDKLISLHLDYTGRAPRREFELFTVDETLSGDILKNRISFLKAGTEEMPAAADIHKREMAYFLDLLEGKVENINDIQRAADTLKYALMQEDI